jgi:gamma-glutamylaminecyclotransferase
MTLLLFVYGSLKEGFPNHHHNHGRRRPGDFLTAVPYPLCLYNGQLPCLLDEPGQGLRVKGQVFEVSEAELSRMDRLERIDEPGGYRRVAIEVIGPDDDAPLQAQVYVQSRALLAPPGPHPGPIDEYTLQHAERLRW